MAQPGPWERFKDGVVMNAINNPLWGGAFFRGSNLLQGHSNAEINAELARRNAAYDAKYKNAPVFQAPHPGSKPHGMDYVSPDNIGRGAVSLVSSLLGGVDLTFLIGGGATRVARVARQAAVQGTADVARQGVNMAEGTQKKFDKGAPARAAAMGAVFQGAHETASALLPKHVIHDEDLTPMEAPEAPIAPDGLPGNGSVRPIAPHEMARIMGDPDAAGVHGINDNVPQRRVNNRDADFDTTIHDEDLQELPPANREFVQQQQAQMPPKSELTPAEEQEMDASAPKPQVPDTYGEVPYEGPPPAANDADLQEPIHDHELAPTTGPDESVVPWPINPDGPKPPSQMEATKAKWDANYDATNVPEGPLTSEGKTHKNFEEHPTDDPDGNKFLTYTAKNGDKLPIKMGIEPDGTAEIAIDQFGNGANKLGPAEIRSAMHDLMDMYPEIKRFGGYRRSGAGKGRVQEIEPGPRHEATAEEAPATEETPEQKPSIWSDERGSFTPWGKSKKEKLADKPDEDLTPEERVLKGLNAAEPVRQAQDAIYTADRRQKFANVRGARHLNSGEAGFHQELGAMKGESEKLPSPYSIRPKLSQDEIDTLFDRVRDHPSLTEGEALRAREGLVKLLANSDAHVPTRNEMDLLRTVFDPAKAPKTPGLIPGLLNIPKSLTTTYDLSAPLRQGVFMVGRKEFYTSLAPMMKALVSEKAETAVHQEIFKNKLYPVMFDSGLALPDARARGNGGPPLASHEEPFQSLASKIPLIGIGVKASERAYNTFIYKLRADSFSTIYNTAKAMGKEWDDKSTASLSKMVNSFTGRGDLGKYNNLAPALNIGLYSPRLLKSRIDILNPKFYKDMDPTVRKEAFKQLVKFGVIAGSVMGMAKLAGAEVGADPRTADGWKIKFGNIRHDILGGEKQLIRLYGNVGTYMLEKGKEVATTGKIHVTRNDKTAMDNVGQFLRNKESPDISFVHDFMAGNDAVGNDFKAGKALASRLLPMFPMDVNEITEELHKEKVPVDKLYVEAVAHSLPDLFGDSVQVYDKKPGGRKTSGKFSSNFGKGFNSTFKSGF